MPASPKGPWIQRFGIVVFTILAGLLFFWLLGFIVDDIGALEGPRLEDVEKRVLDPKLVAAGEALEKKSEALTAEIEALKGRQALLRDSTNSSQQTMNQLLDIQKQQMEKRVAPSAAEQSALAQSENLFLANQARYQALNEEIARRTEEQRALEAPKHDLATRLSAQHEKAQQEYEQLNRRHRLRIAALQLLFLVPILIVAAWLLLKWRTTLYAPLIYATGLATLIKVILVIHENFPTRYFKYILLLVSLVLVVRVLVFLIRAAAHPKTAALLKQYRDAYEHFLCPICEYPIRRGPLQYAFWTRRSIRKLAPATGVSTDEPYVCPSCGTHLFETCTHCGAVRHALLPFCGHCGTEK